MTTTSGTDWAPAGHSLCSVCREEYGSFDPEVWLHRRDQAGGVSAERRHVHPRCIENGKSLALSQGYGWHEGPWTAPAA